MGMEKWFRKAVAQPEVPQEGVSKGKMAAITALGLTTGIAAPVGIVRGIEATHPSQLEEAETIPPDLMAVPPGPGGATIVHDPESRVAKVVVPPPVETPPASKLGVEVSQNEGMQ